MIKWKNDIKIILKSFREIHKIRSGLLILIFFQALFQSVAPIVNIYLSSKIVTLVTNNFNIKNLVFHIVLMIGLNFIILLVISKLNKKSNILKTDFNLKYENKINEKMALLDYPTIESFETHNKKEQIIQMQSLSGSGIGQVLESFMILSRSIFSIVLSASFTMSLFAFNNTDNLPIIFKVVGSPFFLIFLFVAILVNIYINIHSNNTVIKKIYSIMNDTIPFNRIYGYYKRNYITTYQAGKDIRIYNQKDIISDESTSLFNNVTKVFNKISNVQIKYSVIMNISAVIINALIYVFVGLKALAGFIDIGLVVRYIGTINEFTDAFTIFMTQFAVLRTNNEAMQLYFDYIEMPQTMDIGDLSIYDFKNNDFVRYEIEFKNVSFKYPSTEKFVLKNINFKFESNKSLAIVGINGSGKTTMIKLLCRLYDPTEGEITLNGIDIKKYRYDEYIKIFSVIFQDFKLFSFSIGQNVAASNDYDTEKVHDCLKQINFEERLKAMPSDVETYLYKNFSEDGIEISGGEAQKIALARALYRNTPFIILDEPTSALDPIAEAEFYKSFYELVKNKTAVFISHRLSACRFCDDIAVFNEGEVIQRGNHEMLISDKNGKYYELYTAQSQYYQ